MIYGLYITSGRDAERNATAERCRPPIFLTLCSPCRDQRKDFGSCIVCLYWSPRADHKIPCRECVFSPSTIFCLAPDAPPNACTVFIFDLPKCGLKGCILGLGRHLPTVPSASPTTPSSPNTVSSNRETRASHCFAPCTLMRKVHMNQLNSFVQLFRYDNLPNTLGFFFYQLFWTICFNNKNLRPSLVLSGPPPTRHSARVIWSC